MGYRNVLDSNAIFPWQCNLIAPFKRLDEREQELEKSIGTKGFLLAALPMRIWQMHLQSHIFRVYLMDAVDSQEEYKCPILCVHGQCTNVSNIIQISHIGESSTTNKL